MTKPLLTADFLRSCLDYDPNSGLFHWKERPRSHFKLVRIWKTWNTRFAGKEAGWPNGNGYLKIPIGRKHYAHRLAWLIMTGEWPEGQIDHINGARSDNRWVNLRAVTHAENSRNQKLRSGSRTGQMGVRWAIRAKKWEAQITRDGSTVHIGYFTNKADAIAARKSAELDFGFHPNHGAEREAA